MSDFEFRWNNIPNRGPNMVQPQNVQVPAPYARMGQPSSGDVAELREQQNRESLLKELHMNEAKIAELKKRISDNRVNADSIDRRLAANRAGIGDIAASQAHQRAIDERAYRNAMASAAASTSAANAFSEAEERKKKLESDIKYIDLAIADAKDSGKTSTMRQLDMQRKDLVKELGYDPTDGNADNLDLGDYKNWGREQWDMYFEKHTSNGRWDNPERQFWYEANRPQNTLDDIKAVNKSKSTKTDEQYKREQAAEKRRREKAYELADKLNAEINGDHVKKGDMNKRVNAAKRDKEIEELLRYMTWKPELGKFVRK